MARLLVIEDEQSLQKVLDYNLRQAGHDVLVASSGHGGLSLARDAHPDLILLDWMLPDVPGTEVCRMLKVSDETRDIPVIFVTARTEEVDRIVGFELGAADYVVKPFSVRELLLRVSAVLRPREGTARPRGIDVGCLRIDEGAHRVWVRDQPPVDGDSSARGAAWQEVELTLLEWKLLLALYHNRERVQSRGALLDGVWGVDVSITTRTVDTHVKRLRDKLRAAGEYIQTVRGIGYRFAAEPMSDGSDEGARRA